MRFPDFIIGGAMKSATSSLHFILNHHPQIYIPEKEILCLDMDDFMQHPDFFVYSGGRWTYPDWDKDQDKYLEWYSSFFEAAKPDQLAGEDSTTYIASEKPPARMQFVNPKLKLIFILRDPASRTYSHYWHLVRSGKATYRFENMLQFMPGTMLQRSLYKPQIECYLRVFPRERIKIVLFEDFKANPGGVANEVLDFLGLPRMKDIVQEQTQWNQAQVPFSPRLQLLQNSLLRAQSSQRYYTHLPVVIPQSWENRVGSRMRDLAQKAFRIMNPMRSVRTPPMNPETRLFLDRYFRAANVGLSELIATDIDEKWYASCKGAPARYSVR